MSITLYTVNIGPSPNTVSKVTASGSSTVTFATITNNTVADGQAMCVDSNGNIFICQAGTGDIIKVTPSGTVSVFATGLTSPSSICIDSSNTLYVGMQTTPTVKVAKITSGGTVTNPWADTGNAQNCYGMCIDPSGNVFVGSTGGSKIAKITPAGVVTSSWGSTGGFPTYLCSDSSGNIFSANETGPSLSKVTAAGVSTTAFATFSGFTPVSCICDSAGNIFVGSSSTTLAKVTAAGSLTQSYATIGSNAQSLAMDLSTNTLYAACYGSAEISKITSAGVVTAAFGTTGANPQMIVLDPGAGTISGTMTTNLTKVSQSLAGADITNIGTITTRLTKASQSLVGKESNTGTITTRLTKASLSISATNTPLGGTITTRLTKVNQSGAMTISGGPNGTISTALKGISQQAAAPLNLTGSIQTSLRGVSQHATDIEVFTGTITTNLPAHSIQITARTFEQFIGHIVTNLQPINMAAVAEEDIIGRVTTHLGSADGHMTASVVNAEVIILGPIVTNLRGFKTPILGAKLGAPGNGKWYSYRYLDS